MDWNGNLRPPIVFRPDNSLSFLYNYNHDHYPAVVGAGGVGGGGGGGERMMMMREQQQQQQPERKKRLTNEQLEALESSFQEEKQLGPERKMKLARELEMPPRQIAIWFQNRRARWKAKQLEQLYDELKLEYDVVSREREKLQQEVLALKTMLKDQTMKIHVSKGHTEISNTEETVESTSTGNRSSDKPGPSHRPIADHYQPNYHVFNLDDYNPAIMPSYWPNVLPNSYP